MLACFNKLDCQLSKILTVKVSLCGSACLSANRRFDGSCNSFVFVEEDKTCKLGQAPLYSEDFKDGGMEIYIKLNQDGSVPVAVDGSYSSWGSWHSCSVTCGGGTRERRRTYIPPVNGGVEYNLPYGESSLDMGGCNEHYCPIDGVWSDWSYWSCKDLSPTRCCNSLETRKRTCRSPMYGGKDCEGPAEESGQTCGVCDSDDVCLSGTSGTVKRLWYR